MPLNVDEWRLIDKLTVTYNLLFFCDDCDESDYRAFNLYIDDLIKPWNFIRVRAESRGIY